ncbi:hypothetical protein Tco_1339616, partial [Tanacetum coccineum]
MLERNSSNKGAVNPLRNCHHIDTEIGDAEHEHDDLTEIRSFNDHGAPSKWKQVSEITYYMKYVIHKTLEKWIDGMKLKPEFLSVDVKTGYMDDNAVDGHTWRFIKICKESCEDENVVEAYEKMLDFYHGQIKPKNKTKAVNCMISSYQYVGLVNVV